VWIKAGNYRECVNLSANFELYGGFLGHETKHRRASSGCAPTIINANEAGSAIHVTTNINATIDGFTINNGFADKGGGVCCDGGAVVNIRNCRIQNCGARLNGGGIYYGAYASGEVANCVISDNGATDGGGFYSEYHSDPSATSCVIVRNHASGNGGGACFPFHSGANMTNCTLAYNTADSTGGAVYASMAAPTTSPTAYSPTTGRR